MELKLEKVVSVLSILTAWAYSLGWLKRYFFFQTFGVGLSSLNIPVQDYLFESWYVLENVFFFALLLLIAGLVRRVLVWIVVALYFFLPYATHWAFTHPNLPLMGWLTRHDHSVLKFTPFAVLLVLLIWKANRERLRELSWRPTRLQLVVFLVALFAWSVSAAKHFGASDANRVLQSPARYLSRVKLNVSSAAPGLKPLEGRPSLYMLYASPDRYFVWDTTGFVFGQSGQQVNLFEVPRDKVEWIDAWKEPDIQPGAFFF